MSQHFGQSVRTIIGLLLGIACGLFFGEFCRPLKPVGDAFVGLLRMTALPYIAVSLTASIAGFPAARLSRTARAGAVVLIAFWLITGLVIFSLAGSFPEIETDAFFSTTSPDAPEHPSAAEMFIPSNVFAAFAENRVPAVVLTCILAGLALSRVRNRESVIRPLETLSAMLLQISMLIVRLAPAGVFAIAAHAAGTISLDDFSRLQAYLIVYGVGIALLGGILLPTSVVLLTPLSYRDVFFVCRDAVILAFVTGKLIVTIPLLAERTNELMRRKGWLPESDDSAAEQDDQHPDSGVIYPLAYAFPHCGKLLGILFIPFAAWFIGTPIPASEYPVTFGSGLFAYFGGPIVAVPYLLDQARLPHDMFQLFLVSGVIAERFGDATGAIHLTALVLITECILRRRTAVLNYRMLLALPIAGVLLSITPYAVSRMPIAGLSPLRSRAAVMAQLQLLYRPVVRRIDEIAAPNPTPLLPGESLLQRIGRRRTLRVGYNPDKLPFAYFGDRGQLIGFDVEMAHALARDLDVSLEFVPFRRSSLREQLDADHFDVVMSGLVGTLERSASMTHTTPYMDVTLALVTRDHRAAEFRSLSDMRSAGQLRIGYLELSRGFVDRMQELLPAAEFVRLNSNSDYFEAAEDPVDALLTSAESGSALTLLFPSFEVVVPDGIRVSLPLFYVVGNNDSGFRDFLEYWVALKQRDGTMAEFRDHWVFGRLRTPPSRRWNIAQDVLGWFPD